MDLVALGCHGIFECVQLLHPWQNFGQGLVWSGQASHPQLDQQKGCYKIGQEEEYDSYRGFLIEARNWGSKNVLAPKYHQLGRFVRKQRVLLYRARLYGRLRSLWLPLDKRLRLGWRSCPWANILASPWYKIPPQLRYRPSRFEVGKYHDDRYHGRFCSKARWFRSCKDDWA